jgi:hypothetical protein
MALESSVRDADQRTEIPSAPAPNAPAPRQRKNDLVRTLTRAVRSRLFWFPLISPVPLDGRTPGHRLLGLPEGASRGLLGPAAHPAGPDLRRIHANAGTARLPHHLPEQRLRGHGDGRSHVVARGSGRVRVRQIQVPRSAPAAAPDAAPAARANPRAHGPAVPTRGLARCTGLATHADRGVHGHDAPAGGLADGRVLPADPYRSRGGSCGRRSLVVPEVRQVVLPLVIPALITIGILTFREAWNEFDLVLVLVTSPEKRTLPYELYLLSSNLGVPDFPIESAFALLTVLPLILAYLRLEKYVVGGITSGSVK